ncbi:hypothetical protein D3C73_1598590 [compost metagenome]
MLSQMTVDAVGSNVEHAVLEPLDRDVWIFERGVLDLGGESHPVEALGLLGPESIRILDRALVKRVILFGGGMGARDRGRAWLE